MFIAQNPVERSVLVVVTFWYTTLFALAGFHDVPVWHVVILFPASLLVTFTGGVVSIAWMIATYRKSQGITGQDLKAGSRVRQAAFSLGGPLSVPAPAQAQMEDWEQLNAQPWWNLIQHRAPPYAEAIRAVLRILNTSPRFPASPVPGGHGGRTLIEHSLAVATNMLREANSWVYSGQKDKYGNLRVPLQSRPHRFAPADAPLLVLTGLAHDIGKLVCWKPVEDEPEPPRAGFAARVRGWIHRFPSASLPFGEPPVGEHGKPVRSPPLRVHEVLRMHDTEGAHLLRRVPEIMALPIVERGALLAAVGYYHHPMDLPLAPWVTDTVRSLTELLIVADIATGKQEGHVQDETSREDGEDDDPAAPQSPEEPADVATLDIRAVLDAGREQQHNAMQQGGYEFGLLEEALHKPGAVNPEPRFRGQRIAWKRNGWIYVMEPIARRIIANSNQIRDPAWAARAFDEVNGNACPFTKVLLQQLDDRGLLLTEFHDRRYPPTRALFRMRPTPDSNEVPVFVVKASAFPELVVPDPPKTHTMTLTRPLWGEHTAIPEPETSVPAGSETTPPGGPPDTAPVPTGDDAEMGDTPVGDTPVGDTPVGTPPVGVTLHGMEDPGMDAVDGSVDWAAPVDPGDTDSGTLLSGTLRSGTLRSGTLLSGSVDQVVVDTAEVLLPLVLSSGWPVTHKEKNGKHYVLVEVASVGGEALRQEIAMMTAAQPGITFSPLPRTNLEVDGKLVPHFFLEEPPFQDPPVGVPPVGMPGLRVDDTG